MIKEKLREINVKHFRKFFAVTTAVMSFPSLQAQAAGFALYESSARGDGMGGTLIARADSPSALIYNPAGMTQLDGTQIEIGAALIPPRGSVEIGGTETKIKESNHIVPYLYGTYQLNDQVWFGVSLGSRFGLGTAWDENWIGRFSSTEVEIVTISMQPTVAYKINDTVSVALGAEIMHSEVTMGRKVPVAPGIEAGYNLSGDALGIGAVGAIHYSPSDEWRFGLTARTPVKLSFDGESTLGTNIYESEADVTLPGSVALGAAYQVSADLSVEANLIYTFWSSYDELKVESVGLPSMAEEKAWEDVLRVQLGVEYAVNDNWDIRAGYVWDESPIGEYADFLTFPGNRQIVSVGAGYKGDGWNVNAAYAYLFGEKTAYELEGYGQVGYRDSKAHIFNISFGYEF